MFEDRRKFACRLSSVVGAVGCWRGWMN